MILLDLGNALKNVVPECYHYHAHEQTDKYIVWAEDSQANAVWADGKMQEQALSGTVDYFTKTEFDTNVNKIQTTLSQIGVPWRLNSIQYEDDTGYIHYEWVWSLWHG